MKWEEVEIKNGMLFSHKNAIKLKMNSITRKEPSKGAVLGI